MIRKQDYPPNWPEISIAVRTEAGWRCEWCGAPNGKVIRRLSQSEAGKIENHDFPGCDFVKVNEIEETDGEILEVAEKTISLNAAAARCGVTPQGLMKVW